jgi:hypothetical protein
MAYGLGLSLSANVHRFFSEYRSGFETIMHERRISTDPFISQPVILSIISSPHPHTITSNPREPKLDPRCASSKSRPP